ncbi:hypothetical protein SDC9_135664 [bioreactor metagenome]|uniref:Uncharacterized protein n=1 Tax=bioreactor metagenome TaxID=1076179 RepID=A0A645DGF8_9ZZZZ
MDDTLLADDAVQVSALVLPVVIDLRHHHVRREHAIYPIWHICDAVARDVAGRSIHDENADDFLGPHEAEFLFNDGRDVIRIALFIQFKNRVFEHHGRIVEKDVARDVIPEIAGMGIMDVLLQIHQFRISRHHIDGHIMRNALGAIVQPTEKADVFQWRNADRIAFISDLRVFRADIELRYQIEDFAKLTASQTLCHIAVDRRYLRRVRDGQVLLKIAFRMRNQAGVIFGPENLGTKQHPTNQEDNTYPDDGSGNFVDFVGFRPIQDVHQCRTCDQIQKHIRPKLRRLDRHRSQCRIPIS